jgi:7-cyano-7-deazaguanine synthase in queuosine biosynthesis
LKKLFFVTLMDNRFEYDETSAEMAKKAEEVASNGQIDLNLKQLELKSSSRNSSINENDRILEAKKNKWLKSKCRIIKNLIVIGFAWMFLFTVNF